MCQFSLWIIFPYPYQPLSEAAARPLTLNLTESFHETRTLACISRFFALSGRQDESAANVSAALRGQRLRTTTRTLWVVLPCVIGGLLALLTLLEWIAAAIAYESVRLLIPEGADIASVIPNTGNSHRCSVGTLGHEKTPLARGAHLCVECFHVGVRSLLVRLTGLPQGPVRTFCSPLSPSRQGCPPSYETGGPSPGHPSSRGATVQALPRRRSGGRGQSGSFELPFLPPRMLMTPAFRKGIPAPSTIPSDN